MSGKYYSVNKLLVCMQTAIIFAATGAAIELAMHERPNLVTTVSLSLWCVVRAVHCLWLALRDGPHTLQSTPALLRMLPAETVQKVLETAQTPPPPPMARALYQNAISCLPVLTLGLVFQEGTVLVVIWFIVSNGSITVAPVFLRRASRMCMCFFTSPWPL